MNEKIKYNMKKYGTNNKDDNTIYNQSDDEDPEFIIHKKLSLLDRQVAKCNVQTMTNAISIQGDLSYHLYEKHIPEEIYAEYKLQLNSIVKTFLNKCDCK